MSTFTESQTKAIRARGNTLVSAGAGTGKTRTVVERCVRLIVEDRCSLENILMVTFTEAAAAEMRGRLRKELEKIAPGTGWIEEQLALLETAQISTLHAFCLHLVREHFHELAIDPQVMVLDSAQVAPLINETIETLLERCYRDDLPFASAIRALARQYGGADDRIRKLVLKLHRYTQSQPDPEQWFAEQLQRLHHTQPQHWRDTLLVAFRHWREEWLPEVERYSESPNVARCRVALEKPCATTAEMAEAMRCVLAALEDRWPRSHPKAAFRDPIKGFFADAKFFASLTRLDDGADPLQEDWDWVRHPLIALLELSRLFQREYTAAKTAHGGVDFSDLEQLALRLLLDSTGQPTATARACQHKFAHVFVDEYQDINAAQDAILRAVSRGDTDAGSGNRFLVGDVKQSIYAFRLAEPRIFQDYERIWSSGDAGSCIPLSDNFRSQEAILDFVNSLFGTLMRSGIGGIAYEAQAQLRFGAADERHTVSRAADPGPRVELHVIHKATQTNAADADETLPIRESDDDSSASKSAAADLLAIEKEARLLAHRLRALKNSKHLVWDDEKRARREVEWRDMVVLLRSPSDRVETFARQFSLAGVPLAAQRAGFYSAVEITDLINLLRLLDNPLQDIPLAAVLRSPLVGFSLDELAAVRIAANRNPGLPFFTAAGRLREAIAAGEPAPTTSARAKLTIFYKQLGRWRQLTRQTTLSHCLETVLAETHFEALLLAQERGRERLANVRRLLELAQEYDPYQRQGLYRFLRFIDQQEQAEVEEPAASVDATNAVRLMSIHQSKGLEFPVVAVSCLGSPFNLQDLREDILLDPQLGLCPKVLSPRSAQRYPSVAWWFARRRKRLEALGEELRLLYVATTRARDALVLTAFDKGKDAAELTPQPAISERAISAATSPFAWVKLWLRSVMESPAAVGSNSLLRWQWYSDDAPIFATELEAQAQAEPAIETAEEIDGAALQARVLWKYPHLAATKEAAKTNVTALRLRANEDEDARKLFTLAWVSPRAKGLSAAEVGSAHHVFQQRVDLRRVYGTIDLRNQAQQLVTRGVLTEAEAGALDFDALLRFWQSPVGQKICAKAACVHRELPFTAQFTSADLRQKGLLNPLITGPEFIVVQGVIDLALIEPDEILVLDFKTDQAEGEALAQRKEEYSTQVQLYADALERIYQRPVRERWLHFFAHNETMKI